MHTLRESTTAQGVSSKDTWTTDVTYAVSKGYRAKKKDSNSCTHISCLQWWNYHCQEWYYLKNKGRLRALIAMGVNSREIYGCRYPGRWTEWSHRSFSHLLFRYLRKQLGWPTFWDGGQKDMRWCLVTAAPRRAMLDCQVLEKSPGHKEGETVSLPLPPRVALCWY